MYVLIKLGIVLEYLYTCICVQNNDLFLILSHLYFDISTDFVDGFNPVFRVFWVFLISIISLLNLSGHVVMPVGRERNQITQKIIPNL